MRRSWRDISLSWRLTALYVAILVAGFLLREAVIAGAELERNGLSVGIVNLRTLMPIDEAAVLAEARGARLVVTLEDHLLTGGLFSIACEVCQRARIAPRVLPIGFDRRWFTPGLLDDVLEVEGLSGARVAERIARALASPDGPRNERPEPGSLRASPEQPR